MRKEWNSHESVVDVDEKQKTTTIDDVKVAVCPECGHTEMYLEDLTKLK